MFKVNLKNGKSFLGDSNKSILESAIDSGIVLEHSCKTARCRSCLVRVEKGETENIHQDNILSDIEKEQGCVLSCNVKPLSDLMLDATDLGDILISKPQTFPAKIQEIEHITDNLINVKLRLPPNTNFKFLPGQYVNIVKGNIRRSYSIANNPEPGEYLEFIIKNYSKGIMSKYWFNEAKINDVLRLNGPQGTFFMRDTLKKSIIFLATGTGIAPIKSILEKIELEKFNTEEILLFWGARYQEDLFLNRLPLIGDKFYKVVTRPNENWNDNVGYIQDVLLSVKKDFSESIVYACGSNEMIASSKELLLKNGLKETNFLSDAFVSSN
jgi:CDP-4-dehydro-6-deoxyglucose reductase